MSAYVCMNNRTFSCIIELAMRQETITNLDLLAQRLYLLNVESVNQRYNLRESDPEEYKGYMAHLADIRFEPQPGLHDAQRIKAVQCWIYQSCEGDCEDDPLFKAVDKIVKQAKIDCARRIAEENGVKFDPYNASSIIYSYLGNHKELENTWE